MRKVVMMGEMKRAVERSESTDTDCDTLNTCSEQLGQNWECSNIVKTRIQLKTSPCPLTLHHRDTPELTNIITHRRLLIATLSSQYFSLH